MGWISPLDLRVLGALELLHDGRPVGIGSEKIRLLLAALAVDADRVVSEDRLIDVLWAERPPATAHATLQKYVYRLREILAAHVLSVATRANGYVLLLGDAQLDADRFARAVAEAHTLAADDPSAALSLYDDALALWRGPAWDGFTDREPFRTDATRLGELRTGATEERIDLALACGRHHEVIVELEPIIAAAPLHERFRGQLMLALYRSGRQVDALRAFREFRAYLVEETGLEPTRELQELEDDIIQQKRHLDLPSGRPEVVTDRDVLALPAALLTDGGPIFGRRADLDWLEGLWAKALGGDAQLALLCGAAGIGKTRLLAELAREVHARGACVQYRSGAEHGLATRHGPHHDARGTLIVLDDLELVANGDPASTVAGVVNEAYGEPVLVVGTCRDVPDRALLGAVKARALRALTVDDVATALAAIAELDDRELAAAVLDETGGVPGVVVAIAEQLRERELSARLDRALERARRAVCDLRSAQDEIGVTALDRTRRSRRADHTLTDAACPYKGLASFDATDATRFCGRDRLIAAVIARLAVSSFVGIIGASGSGKSSLLHAGLVPALAGGALPGSQDWDVVLATPGREPLAALQAALAPRVDHSRRRVVVVDQLEELFTTCSDPLVRAAFMDELSSIASNAPANTAVVVALRADYYGNCGGHAGFARLLESSQVLVGAMSPAELRDAIVEPAERVGCHVDDAVVDLVCRDAGSEPGALPLVSTALMETWTRRDGDTLTAAAYESAGGVRGALARLADRAFTSLDDEQRLVARRVFLRLAQVGEGNDDVRRRAPRGEIDAIVGTSGVVEVLAAHRLVTVDRDSVEVAHEALLREWPRLRGWLEEDRDGRRLQARLADAATEWDREGRDPTLLYRATKLAAAAEWSVGHPNELTASESSFVAASRAAEGEELRVARRSARRRAHDGVGPRVRSCVRRRLSGHRRDAVAAREPSQRPRAHRRRGRGDRSPRRARTQPCVGSDRPRAAHWRRSASTRPVDRDRRRTRDGVGPRDTRAPAHRSLRPGGSVHDCERGRSAVVVRGP